MYELEYKFRKVYWVCFDMVNSCTSQGKTMLLQILEICIM